ncbi:hypothetical protein J2S73_001381 [Amorphus orientalis]|uniref:Uncharacterized protein n=1 Tax=Amorphus orientalis TaxID=649198 RepID=A0AAE3VMP4_9HYPH|nr:hypothetical protein [Amorphus orientalis]
MCASPRTHFDICLFDANAILGKFVGPEFDTESTLSFSRWTVWPPKRLCFAFVGRRNFLRSPTLGRKRYRASALIPSSRASRRKHEMRRHRQSCAKPLAERHRACGRMLGQATTSASRQPTARSPARGDSLVCIAGTFPKSARISLRKTRENSKRKIAGFTLCAEACTIQARESAPRQNQIVGWLVGYAPVSSDKMYLKTMI